MKRQFDKDMEKLCCVFKNLTNHVQAMMDDVRRCLENFDLDLAHEIIHRDSEINTLVRDLERGGFSMILRRHPVAGDYRVITTLVKVAPDCERIGDYCKEICEILCVQQNPLPAEETRMLLDMLSVARDMYQMAVESLLKRDRHEADQAISMDDDVDRMFVALQHLCVKGIREGKGDPATLLDIFQMGKYLERMGDRCESLGSWEWFMADGEFPER